MEQPIQNPRADTLRRKEVPMRERYKDTGYTVLVYRTDAAQHSSKDVVLPQAKWVASEKEAVRIAEAAEKLRFVSHCIVKDNATGERIR